MNFDNLLNNIAKIYKFLNTIEERFSKRIFFRIIINSDYVIITSSNAKYLPVTDLEYIIKKLTDSVRFYCLISVLLSNAGHVFNFQFIVETRRRNIRSAIRTVNIFIDTRKYIQFVLLVRTFW